MNPANLSLRTRMVMASIAGIIALTSLYSFIVIGRVEQAQREEVDKRGTALAAQLAKNLELPVRAGDRDSMRHELEDAARNQDVRTASVTVGGETFREGPGGPGIEFHRPVAAREAYTDEVQMLEAGPTAGNRAVIAKVSVVLGLDSLERLMHQIRWAMLAAALLTGSGAIGTAFLFARRLARPLAELAIEAEKVGAGDFEARVTATGGGAEIQALAVNMNRMAESLKQNVARIIQQEKMASLGHMASGITHEIGNPLNSIMLDSGLLLANLPAGPEREIVTAIHDQARRMKDIVRHLLDYARPDLLVAEPVALDLALDEAMRVLAHPLRKSRMTIERQLPDLPPINCMKNMFVQVLVNVITNAIEVTGEDGRLTVSAQVSGKEVLVCLTDNGPGIPPDLLDRVFEPFFTTRRESHGTGIGLAVCRQILSVCNGSIWAERGDQGGARICIRAPLWDGESGKPASHPG